MKKSLLALTVLGALACGAQAATVNLYGVVDEALVVNKVNPADAASTTSWGLESGYNAGSRFGLIGKEDLGNGLYVAFKLENGFAADAGTLGQGNRLFGREARATLGGDFGAVSFGRMGGLASSAGTFDIVFANIDAFDGGDNAVGTGFAMSSRNDNTITYQTPTVAGLTGYVQYSLNSDGQEAAVESQNDRYLSAGATYELGALTLVGAWENQKYKNGDAAQHDSHTYTLGGNYDLGVAKLFAGAQYAKNGAAMGLAETKTGYDGYALTLGTVVPAFGGDITYAAYYANYEVAGNSDDDGSYFGTSARYTYPLSKRTSVYGGVGYNHQSAVTGADAGENYQGYVGLTHKF